MDTINRLMDTVTIAGYSLPNGTGPGCADDDTFYLVEIRGFYPVIPPRRSRISLAYVMVGSTRGVLQTIATKFPTFTVTEVICNPVDVPTRIR
jgi:hypothetical protein